MDTNVKPSDFRQRVPIRIYSSDGTVMVDWIDLDGAGLREPFFEDTIHRLLRLPYNQLFRAQTSFALLRQLYDEDRRQDPTGFIFHISRCGSTLISQMLASSERNVVVSEAPPIDRVIRSRDLSPEKLRWILNAYAPSRESGRLFFVKFDSWALSHIDAILETFPHVPWVFLYREPVEVIVSLLRQPGYHAVPGMIDAVAPPLTPEELFSITREEYCARVIGRFCEQGLSLAERPNGKLVNYTQLPEAVTGEITGHFKVTLTDHELHSIQQASIRSAKRPYEAFEPDSDSKRAEASAQVRAAANKWVRPFYEKLEALRIGASAATT